VLCALLPRSRICPVFYDGRVSVPCPAWGEGCPSPHLSGPNPGPARNEYANIRPFSDGFRAPIGRGPPPSEGSSEEPFRAVFALPIARPCTPRFFLSQSRKKTSLFPHSARESPPGGSSPSPLPVTPLERFPPANDESLLKDWVMRVRYAGGWLNVRFSVGASAAVPRTSVSDRLRLRCVNRPPPPGASRARLNSS